MTTTNLIVTTILITNAALGLFQLGLIGTALIRNLLLPEQTEESRRRISLYTTYAFALAAGMFIISAVGLGIALKLSLLPQ